VPTGTTGRHGWEAKVAAARAWRDQVAKERIEGMDKTWQSIII
jgi:hypothetical protein